MKLYMFLKRCVLPIGHKPNRWVLLLPLLIIIVIMILRIMVIIVIQIILIMIVIVVIILMVVVSSRTGIHTIGIFEIIVRERGSGEKSLFQC